MLEAHQAGKDLAAHAAVWWGEDGKMPFGLRLGRESVSRSAGAGQALVLWQRKQLPRDFLLHFGMRKGLETCPLAGG